MKLDEILHAAGKHRRRKRVGRGTGSGHGKTAGRGTKGFYSRSGAARRSNYEGGGTTTFLRVAKRGFSNAGFRKDYQVVNVSDLEKFADGARVDAAALVEAGLIEHLGKPVKILGDGQLTRKLTVSACKFSATAAQKITQAGGTMETA